MVGKSIYEKTKLIRELINKPRRHHILSASEYFYQIASALDVVVDTERAINAFSLQDFGRNQGALYLAVYGLLQAIYVQQDAVVNLLNPLLDVEKRIKNYPRLNEIRSIRNQSIGHPTSTWPTETGGPTSHHFISQRTLSQAGFELVSYTCDGEFQHNHVDIPNLLADQAEFIAGILDTIIEGLQEEEREHKEKFRMEKMMAMFPSNTRYLFEKVEGAILGCSPPDVALGCFDSIKRVIVEFKESVKRRDEAYWESLEDEYELIEYAIMQIEDYLQAVEDGEDSPVNQITARILCIFLKSQVNTLQECAEQIDKEYQGDS